MKYLKLCGLIGLAFGLAVACGDAGSEDGEPGANGDVDGGADSGADVQTEVRKGERGSSCDSTNDCAEGLSCIVTNDCPIGVACANKSCQPSNFDIIGTGKQCHIVDCATTDDCCGDLPQQTPAKCANRDSICFQPTLTGCVATTCTSSTTCLAGGTCPAGTCSLDAESCQVTGDCAANTCDTNIEPDTCTVSGTDCSAVACATNVCSTRFCDCTNPEYNPTDPICTDPDCEGICGFVCEDERCVADTSCETNTECPLATPFCDAAGECVECLTSDDCTDEECVAGRCGPECEQDTQCSLFEACQSNECVFVGCQSDRECVLGANANPGQDPRLARCNIEAGIGTCVFPCEIDAQCSPTEVCLDGVCEYIGCETNGECKTIAGLHNQPVPTDERPWITTAECREETSASE